MSFINYFRKSVPVATPYPGNEDAQQRYYKKLRLQVLIAALLSHSLYYVCRTTLNVVKEPILDNGALNATQLGMIGSAMLFVYAVGKFVNGFLADYSNIKRFMAAGLILSAAANLIIGIAGFLNGDRYIGNAIFFLTFIILWGINGWAQSMGGPPGIVSLSRWYPLSTRGTYYGFFSASHNLGEFFSFLFVGAIVGLCGWHWGFAGSAVAGAIGIAIIIALLHDSPESKGLPPIEVLTGEEKSEEHKARSTRKMQRTAVRNPLVWMLALSSACMYVARYAVNGWGVLFLQEVKGFTLVEASQIVSVNALLGIFGAVCCGWLTDRFLHGRRNVLAFIVGLINTAALCLFFFSGSGMSINILSMVLFGTTIGILICFLGGLMAIDIVPREATGATIGIVGLTSYIGAGMQDIISGRLLDAHKVMIGSETHYNFTPATLFWIAASTLSFLLVLFVSRKQQGKEHDNR